MIYMMRWICGVVKSSQLSPIASANPLEFRRIQSQILQFSSVFRLPIENSNPRSSISSDRLLNEVKIGTFHAKAIKDGSAQILQMGNYLLNHYVMFQNIGDARKLFDEFSERDVRSWTTLISGFARVGYSNLVFELFKMMQNQGVCPDQFTLSALLKCCSGLNEPRIGTEIHGRILRSGIEVDVALANSLLDFYVKHKEFSYAERFFEMMGERDTGSVNVIIGAYMQMGDVEKSLDLFRKMSSEKAASWNTVIHGLIRSGYEKVASELLYVMVDTGVAMDEWTFSIAFMLASSLADLKLGREIHSKVIRAGIHNHEFIKTSIVDMYCKCGQMETASVLFDIFSHDFGRRKRSMISSDGATTQIILWSSLVSGYVKNARYVDALKIFPTMILKQVAVDVYTLTSLVSACANAGNLELGRQIHAYIQKIGHKPDDFLASSLVDMYSKCGSLNEARVLFSQTPTRNVVIWTSIICGCAVHGQGKEAVFLFEKMVDESIMPNDVTFVGVLNACSHAGLLKEGCKYFKLMKEVYGISPGVEHYTCMVDLYGRTGHLDKAKEFIYSNDISHLSSVWRPLLSSCRIHKNVKMANWVSEILLKLEPLDADSYVLTSNVYAASQRWEESANMRILMQDRGIGSVSGQSWIQLKNQIHTFVTGDASHPHNAVIYSFLQELITKLKEIGYSSDVSVVMQDVEEEQKELLLGFHSEKLAIAYGIISTNDGAPVRVMKNLRICTDCHNFIKYTSQFLGREIIVRDIRRFHHFKEGHCSCGDFW